MPSINTKHAWFLEVLCIGFIAASFTSCQLAQVYLDHKEKELTAQYPYAVEDREKEIKNSQRRIELLQREIAGARLQFKGEEQRAFEGKIALMKETKDFTERASAMLATLKLERESLYARRTKIKEDIAALSGRHEKLIADLGGWQKEEAQRTLEQREKELAAKQVELLACLSLDAALEANYSRLSREIL